MKSIDFWIVVFLVVVFVSACAPQKVVDHSDSVCQRQVAVLEAKVAELEAQLLSQPCHCGGDCENCDCTNGECKAVKVCPCDGDCAACDCKNKECQPAEPPVPPAAVVITAPPAASACSAGYCPQRSYQPYRPLRGLFRRR